MTTAWLTKPISRKEADSLCFFWDRNIWSSFDPPPGRTCSLKTTLSMICLFCYLSLCHFKSREPNFKTQSPTRISRSASWTHAAAPRAGWKGSFASYLMARWCSEIRSPFVACNIPAPSTRTQRDSNQNTIWEGSPADTKPLLQGVWDTGAPLSCLCHLCASPLRSPALWELLVFFCFCLLWECGPRVECLFSVLSL